MVRYIAQFLVLLPIVVNLSSCATSKQLQYFKDLPSEASVSKLKTLKYAPLKLQTDDEVQITISSASPEASQFFNLVAIAPAPGLSSTSPSAGQPQGYINLYRVSSEGTIALPVLGNVQASGLSTEELKAIILEKLKDYLKDAVVTVRLTNFKVTVIGEVGNPIVVPVNGQTINVIEAIGAAGDMTVYGIRKNVRIIRKLPDGSTEVAILDFNKSDVMQSPWFQLRQNDIVYVQPSKNKGVLASRTDIWVPILTAVLYTAAIFFSQN